MNASDKPSPFALYVQARHEVDKGKTEATVKDRYRELMIKHGLLVPREEGDDGNLPCGWPGNSR